MNAHPQEMLELVSVYALGGIDAATGECAVIREHIAHCDECQQEFRRSLSAATALGLSVAESPPAGLRNRILSALPSRVMKLPARRPMRWYIPAAAAAAIIIAAGVWWKTQFGQQQRWALTCMPAVVNCHARGVVTTAGVNMQLQIHGLAMLPAGKQYQAWMIMPGKAPTPEPVFSPTPIGDGLVAFTGTPVKGALVAITEEPSGGSTKPTTKPFLIAQID